MLVFILGWLVVLMFILEFIIELGGGFREFVLVRLILEIDFIVLFMVILDVVVDVVGFFIFLFLRFMVLKLISMLVNGFVLVVYGKIVMLKVWSRKYNMKRVYLKFTRIYV